jgi:hypothetical protein
VVARSLTGSAMCGDERRRRSGARESVMFRRRFQDSGRRRVPPQEARVTTDHRIHRWMRGGSRSPRFLSKSFLGEQRFAKIVFSKSGFRFKCERWFTRNDLATGDWCSIELRPRHRPHRSPG